MGEPVTGPGAAGDDSPGAGGSRVAGVVLRVDPASGDAPFRQLEYQIVEAIRRGELATGTRMPPVRRLAQEVGVATATAAKVYRELEESGQLEGRGRSGTFVAAPDLPSDALARAAVEFAARATGAGFSEAKAVEAVRAAFAQRR